MVPASLVPVPPLTTQDRDHSASQPHSAHWTSPSLVDHAVLCRGCSRPSSPSSPLHAMVDNSEFYSFGPWVISSLLDPLPAMSPSSSAAPLPGSVELQWFDERSQKILDVACMLVGCVLCDGADPKTASSSGVWLASAPRHCRSIDSMTTQRCGFRSRSPPSRHASLSHSTSSPRCKSTFTNWSVTFISFFDWTLADYSSTRHT